MNHKTIPAEEYIKLHTYPKLTIHCEKYNEKYKNFCPNHQTLLCIKCMKTTHKSCKDVISLAVVTQHAKSDGILENMKTNIDDILQTLQNI